MSSKLIEKIFEILDKNVDSFNKNYQERKNKFKKWITNEFDFQLPNWLKVFVAGIISFFIFRYFYEVFINLDKEIKKMASFWTLASLIISSPVAFIIWYFRDQNATQQIENQRKDINLKEFQKIAEWVSGQHLTEYEVTEKEILEDGKKAKFVEKTKKYGMQNTEQSIPTFSKSDGAVGLQIAAIYSLLPFFRGEHGESFRRPALNLLTSAWLSLQQKELLVLEKLDVLTQKEEFDSQIENIQKRATSPIGVALTQVLLSDGGDNLLKFPEVFPNLCLAGIDFHLPGLHKKVLALFHRTKDCQGINLIGANLREANLSSADLIGADLSLANLSMANLSSAKLGWANLSSAKLGWADLSSAKLGWADLSSADLASADLIGADLRIANLSMANLIMANLSGSNLSRANLSDSNLRIANLSGSNLSGSNLSGSNLSSANLSSADLNGANLCEVKSVAINTFSNVRLVGAIIIDTGNTTLNNDIKQKGGVVLYKKSNQWKFSKIKIIQDNIEFTHKIYFDLDLAKTQQENPDWQISLEDI